MSNDAHLLDAQQRLLKGDVSDLNDICVLNASAYALLFRRGRSRFLRH